MSSLIVLTEQHSYHLYRKETDMREGGHQVMGGDAFISINKPRTRLKLTQEDCRQSGISVTFLIDNGPLPI
jgi:hypothetical protein